MSHQHSTIPKLGVYTHALPSIVARKIPSFEKKMSGKEGTWGEDNGMVMGKEDMA